MLFKEHVNEVSLAVALLQVDYFSLGGLRYIQKALSYIMWYYKF